MGYQAKVQLIQRKSSKQWYITLPCAFAEAMGFKKGETVEWIIEERGKVLLKRKRR